MGVYGWFWLVYFISFWVDYLYLRVDWWLVIVLLLLLFTGCLVGGLLGLMGFTYVLDEGFRY